MLRAMFGEDFRREDGALKAANQVISDYRKQLHQLKPKTQDMTKDVHHWDLWANGFLRALDELEQSQYCAIKFARLVHQPYLEQMKSEELNNYYRHIYFYKNAVIRVFSILDKLGYFMNDLFQLKTEKVKPHFSYFTVLRRMHDRHLYMELEQQLFDLKTKHQVALNKLRDQRNVEIHSMNAEMIDDMQGINHGYFNGVHIENLAQNLHDLEQCCMMVYQTITMIFSFAQKIVH